MSDIVERLREAERNAKKNSREEVLFVDAADEIERLRAELDAERDAAAARAEKAEGLLLDAYNTWGGWPQETLARIADFLNKGGGK